MKVAGLVLTTETSGRILIQKNLQSEYQNPGKEVYAVYFDYENDHTGEFAYFIGCKTRANTEIPEGMENLVIPEHSYFKVTAKGTMPDCIANSWKNIWNSEINRGYKYDFEVYDQRSID